MTTLESLTKKLHALLPELRELSFTLEHILKALCKVGKRGNGDTTLGWFDGKAFYQWRVFRDKETKQECGWQEDGENYYYFWELGLHLDKQSPELIEWLDNLIPDHPTK